MKKINFDGMSDEQRNEVLEDLENNGIIGTCNDDMEVIISDEDAKKIEELYVTTDFQIVNC